jgi:hypothetical protein
MPHMEDNSLRNNMKKMFLRWVEVVRNMNNYAITGLKERIKVFVGAMKPINKISTLVI